LEEQVRSLGFERDVADLVDDQQWVAGEAGEFGLQPAAGVGVGEPVDPLAGKSDFLLASGSAAVEAGHRVRYHSAADLVDTLYRGQADNSVGKVIDGLLRNELTIVEELGFAPLDDTAQLLFRFVAAAYERRSLGIGYHWPFEAWGLSSRTHHRRLHARPAPPPLPHHHHRRPQLSHETSSSQRRNQDQQQLETSEEVGTFNRPLTETPRTGH
jgi:hypothetical protein